MCYVSKSTESVGDGGLVKGDFLFLRGTVEELFDYIFGIYIKFGYKNQS